jgi:hypothetical protein
VPGIRQAAGGEFFKSIQLDARRLGYRVHDGSGVAARGTTKARKAAHYRYGVQASNFLDRDLRASNSRRPRNACQ